MLEFKSRVGITLTPEEREDYTSNIKTFVDSKIEELQSRTFAAHIHVQTYIGGTKKVIPSQRISKTGREQTTWNLLICRMICRLL